MKRISSLKWMPVAALLSLLGLSSCNPGTNDDRTPPPGGEIDLHIQHTFEAAPLRLAQSYVPTAGDTVTIEKFRYYLSHVALVNSARRDTTRIPDSYHLVNLHALNADAPARLRLRGLRPGTYDRILFSVGIDSVRNLSTDRVGDLDPNNDMAWNWNTGYKFLLVEGRYRIHTSAGPVGGGLVYHVGNNHNYRSLSLALPQPVQVNLEQPVTVHLRTDAKKIFEGLRIADAHNVMAGPNASRIADNFAASFGMQP